MLADWFMCWTHDLSLVSSIQNHDSLLVLMNAHLPVFP